MTEAVAVLVAVFVFFSIFGGENFLSAGGAASWLNVASELGIIALPIGLLMIAGLAHIDVPVTTANGAALAAEVPVGEIAVGSIVMRNVGALVARPGALEESLLGMSFLERLKSYTVERGRLVLTAKRRALRGGRLARLGSDDPRQRGAQHIEPGVGADALVASAHR